MARPFIFFPEIADPAFSPNYFARFERFDSIVCVKTPYMTIGVGCYIILKLGVEQT